MSKEARVDLNRLCHPQPVKLIPPARAKAAGSETPESCSHPEGNKLWELPTGAEAEEAAV